MFTVKSINHGMESYHQADYVIRYHDDCTRPADHPQGLCLFSGPPGSPGELTAVISTGTAYVMNEAGATVGKHMLGALATAEANG